MTPAAAAQLTTAILILAALAAWCWARSGRDRIRSIKIVRSAPNDRLIDWAPNRVRARGTWWHYINLPFGLVLVIAFRRVP